MRRDLPSEGGGPIILERQKGTQSFFHRLERLAEKKKGGAWHFLTRMKEEAFLPVPTLNRERTTLLLPAFNAEGHVHRKRGSIWLFPARKKKEPGPVW